MPRPRDPSSRLLRYLDIVHSFRLAGTEANRWPWTYCPRGVVREVFHDADGPAIAFTSGTQDIKVRIGPGIVPTIRVGDIVSVLIKPDGVASVKVLEAAL